MASGFSSLSNSIYNERALLIGNNTYKTRSKLQFCSNDAEDLGKKLRSIGFEVTVDTNRTYEQMDRMIEKFNSEICEGDLILLFFAGHGYQCNEQNFLIPIDDDRIKKDIDLKDRAINAQSVLEKIMSRRPLAAIFLLDCCRQNFERGSLNSSGLSTMRAVAGSLIAYACDANKTALDRSTNGRNGMFTAHLLEHITLPNVTIDEIMYDVCDGVMKDTDNDQCPVRISSLRRKVYLNLNQQIQSEIDPGQNTKYQRTIDICQSPSHMSSNNHKNISEEIKIETQQNISPLRVVKTVCTIVGASIVAVVLVLSLGAKIFGNRTDERRNHD